MTTYALMCLDKPDSLALRMANREAHLAYVRGFAEKIVMAGPLLSDAGEMAGSLLVLEVADRAEAEAFAAGDPYARAGLFARTELHALRLTLGSAAR